MAEPKKHPAGPLGPWVPEATVYPKVWDAIAAAPEGLTLAGIRQATGLRPHQVQRCAMRMVDKGLAVRTRTMTPFPMYIMHGPRKGKTTIMREAWLYQFVDNVR